MTNYIIRCTSVDSEDRCIEVLPANSTSFNLTVNAGVWYTISVIAVNDGRESKSSPPLNVCMLSWLQVQWTVYIWLIVLSVFTLHTLLVCVTLVNQSIYNQIFFFLP